MSKKAPTKSDRKRAKLEERAQDIPGLPLPKIPEQLEAEATMDKMQNQYRNPPDLEPSLLTTMNPPEPGPPVVVDVTERVPPRCVKTTSSKPKAPVGPPTPPPPGLLKKPTPTRHRKKASEYRIYQEAKVQPTEGTGLEPFTVLKEVGDVPCASREKAFQLAETAAKDNPNKVFHVHRILGRLINKEALTATLVRL